MRQGCLFSLFLFLFSSIGGYPLAASAAGPEAHLQKLDPTHEQQREKNKKVTVKGMEAHAPSKGGADEHRKDEKKEDHSEKEDKPERRKHKKRGSRDENQERDTQGEQDAIHAGMGE